MFGHLKAFDIVLNSFKNYVMVSKLLKWFKIYLKFHTLHPQFRPIDYALLINKSGYADFYFIIVKI
jgi:hypothetical protein